MDSARRDDDAAAGNSRGHRRTGAARMLFCLMDGHARTSTELAVVAGVSPSTASVHLDRLKSAALVESDGTRKVSLLQPRRGRDSESARRLSVLAGGRRAGFEARHAQPSACRKTCYDHLAGALGVQLNDRFQALGWVSAYEVKPEGEEGFRSFGIDLEVTKALRRRFAYACLGLERTPPHIGGALGAAILKSLLKKKWLIQDLDSRALEITPKGRRELQDRFGPGRPSSFLA